MSVQTAVLADPTTPFAGKINGTNFQSIPRINNFGRSIDFGIGCVQSASGEDLVDFPTGTGFSLLGVIAHQHRDDNRTLAGNLGLADKMPCQVVTNGQIWVLPEVTVAVDDDVYCRHTDNGALLRGNFRNDGDSSKADKVTNARWLTAGSATKPALLQINLP